MAWAVAPPPDPHAGQARPALLLVPVAFSAEEDSSVAAAILATVLGMALAWTSTLAPHFLPRPGGAVPHRHPTKTSRGRCRRRRGRNNGKPNLGVPC
eukprot:CAMPEP_0180528654 /NCGR_PEP_ID=MMETSP1036_2-20121128/60914_1 /TAXON_ID=632150 /ORGANISM="Azadinium spinosum, Strain 3D9" /LENGTH=96 /DNA_ID=CAMNT_0022542229 /DNA_START=24 /DNA_END=314 /DNA_ORIENTATION=-